MFGEDPEDIPDPNKPENIPYINALKKQRVDSFKRFAEGQGKVLFEQWQMELRTGLHNVLTGDDGKQCTCPLSFKMGQLRYLLKLICNAQEILEGE